MKTAREMWEKLTSEKIGAAGEDWIPPSELCAFAEHYHAKRCEEAAGEPSSALIEARNWLGKYAADNMFFHTTEAQIAKREWEQRSSRAVLLELDRRAAVVAGLQARIAELTRSNALLGKANNEIAKLRAELADRDRTIERLTTMIDGWYDNAEGKEKP